MMHRREKIICGLDIGSSKILAVAAKADKQGKLDLMSGQLIPAQGIDRGNVVDLGSLTDCLVRIRNAIFKKSGIRPQETLVGIKGICFKTKRGKTVIPLLDRADKVITTGDIKKVNHQAKALTVDIEEEVLHEIPQSYTIDDYNVVKNPLGLYGRKLGVDMLMITSPMGHLDNLIKALNQSGWRPKRLVYSPLCAAYSVLSQEEMEKGSVLVDMGAGSTEILIFKDGILRQLEIIPMGGVDFTEALAAGLNITFDLAEEIKKSHATASTSEVEDTEDILIRKSATYNPVKRKRISEVIEPKILQLLQLLKEKIESSSYRRYFNSGAVVTGGSSLLYGFLEYAESYLRLPVKMGKVRELSLNYYQIPAYASGLGLLKNAVYGPGQEVWVGLDHKRLPKKWVARIRELYQEYF